MTTNTMAANDTAAAKAQATGRRAQLDPGRAPRGAQVEREPVDAEPNFLNDGALER